MRSYYHIPDIILQTYALIAVGSMDYLVGAHVNVPDDIILVSIIVSFILFFTMVYTENPLVFSMFAFFMGIASNLFFWYVDIISPLVIDQAMGLVLIVFIGLVYIARASTDYQKFYRHGTIYLCMSTILGVSIMNIFFQNTLVEIFIIWIPVMIFSIFVITDTQKIMTFTNKSPIYCILQLLLDFMNMFLGFRICKKRKAN